VDLSLTSDAETSDPLVQLVRTPPRSRLPPALLFVASFVLFLLAGDRDMSIEHLAILAGVLLFHEAGHAVGMIALGYRDVRIFFIPFLGAATAGKPDGGPGWRHGIVLLMGPMPGIIAGAALALATGAPAGTTAGYAVRVLVFVNAFNLLPVVPLDGGRLLELVVFSRHRLLELLSRIASVVALVALAIHWRSIPLGVVAYFQAVAVPGGLTVARAAAALRRERRELPRRVEDASSKLIHDVDDQLLNAAWGSRSIAARASWLRLIIERAIDAERAPGILGSLALLLAWGTSVAVAFVAIVISVKAR